MQQYCELFTYITVVWVNESMPSSLLINCNHHKKKIPYNKKKEYTKFCADPEVHYAYYKMGS